METSLTWARVSNNDLAIARLMLKISLFTLIVEDWTFAFVYQIPFIKECLVMNVDEIIPVIFFLDHKCINQ